MGPARGEVAGDHGPGRHRARVPRVLRLRVRGLHDPQGAVRRARRVIAEVTFRSALTSPAASVLWRSALRAGRRRIRWGCSCGTRIR